MTKKYAERWDAGCDSRPLLEEADREIEQIRADISQAYDLRDKAEGRYCTALGDIERLQTQLLEVNKALGLDRDNTDNAERVKAALRLRAQLPLEPGGSQSSLQAFPVADLVARLRKMDDWMLDCGCARHAGEVADELERRANAPGPSIEPFAVKHYTGDAQPCIKGNGFDGLLVGEDREEAQAFVDWLNARLQAKSGGSRD